MKYVEQREESLQRIASITREESLPQIVSGNYYHNVILQNLSEQDICFDSKDLIDQEKNAVDLYDQQRTDVVHQLQRRISQRPFTVGKKRLKSAASKVFSEFSCELCAKQ